MPPSSPTSHAQRNVTAPPVATPQTPAAPGGRRDRDGGPSGATPPAKRLDARTVWKALPSGSQLTHEELTKRLILLEQHYEAGTGNVHQVTMDHARRHDQASALMERASHNFDALQQTMENLKEELDARAKASEAKLEMTQAIVQAMIHDLPDEITRKVHESQAVFFTDIEEQVEKALKEFKDLEMRVTGNIKDDYSAINSRTDKAVLDLEARLAEGLHKPRPSWGPSSRAGT